MSTLRHQPRTDLAPVRIIEHDLRTPLVDQPSRHAGTEARALWVLVRLAEVPLGFASARFVGTIITAETLAAAIDHQLGDTVRRAIAKQGGNLRGPITSTSVADLGIAAAPDAALGDMPLVTVVVTTCALTPTLLDVVRSILAGRYTHIEVLVVDNRPNASEVPDALQSTFPTTVVRYLPEHRQGLSYARNCGLAAATGRYVAFTDDDVTADPRWVESIVDAFTRHPDVAGVSGPILPRELDTRAQLLMEQFGGHTRTLEERLFDLDEHALHDALYPYAAAVFGSGANSAFRVDVLRSIGGFDVCLGAGTTALGGEDLDLGVRLVVSGHRLMYSPKPLVWHVHHRDMKHLRRQLRNYGAGLTAYLTKQFVTSPEARRHFFHHGLRGLRYVLARNSDKNARKTEDYPRSLTVLERAGMLYGPIGYLRSRVRARRTPERPRRARGGRKPAQW